jgi:hypothetical protein
MDAVGGDGVVVHVPDDCQALLIHRYVFFWPAKADEKVRLKDTVIVDPFTETLELYPLRIHWLFCRTAALPGTSGPSQAVAASFTINNALELKS